MEKYLVVWVIKEVFLDVNREECVSFKDHYQAFVDYEDNLKSATDFYEYLLLNEYGLYTANVCLVVKSTDY